MRGITPTAAQLIDLLADRAATAETLTFAEWEQLIALAHQHSVAPVVYVRLKERGLTPPPAALEQLRSIYLNSLARNTRLFHERDRVLRALAAAQLQVVPFKGACLGEVVYGNIALRAMGDIDLWVLQPQLEAACAVMQTLGYTSHSKADRPQALQDALTGETQFFGPKAPLVELHWTIFPGEWLRHTARVDEHLIWQRTQPLSSDLIRQLSPEDAVIQLCVHLAVNHQLSEIGLRTMLDLDFARRAWRIDWRVVGQRARSWRVTCATWLVLKLFAELWGDPENQLPVSDLAPSGLRQWALNRLVSVHRLMEGIHLSRGPRRFLLLLLLIDRPIDALALIGRALFPDRTWLTLRYGLQTAPRWRVGLQRLWHPILVTFRRAI